MSHTVEELTRNFKYVVLGSDTQVHMSNAAFLHKSGFDGQKYYVSVNGSQELSNHAKSSGSREYFVEEWMVSLESDPNHPLQDIPTARKVLDSFFLTHWNVTSDELKEDSECLFTRKLPQQCYRGKCALARRSSDYFTQQKKKIREG